MPYVTAPNTVYPYDAVGEVLSDTKAGTGALIGTNVVLTASHVLDTLSPMRFIPGRSGAQQPFGQYYAKWLYYGIINEDEGKLTQPQSGNDYAVLAFDRNFFTQGLGYFGMTSEYNGGQIRTAGYHYNARQAA